MTKPWISRFVAAGGAVLALSLPTAAVAQDYPGGVAPQVKSETLAREVPTKVLGESLSRDSDSLPVTGGDVAGLIALGLGAVGAGTVLVRRSRTRIRTA